MAMDGLSSLDVRIDGDDLDRLLLAVVVETDSIDPDLTVPDHNTLVIGKESGIGFLLNCRNDLVGKDMIVVRHEVFTRFYLHVLAADGNRDRIVYHRCDRVLVAGRNGLLQVGKERMIDLVLPE